jgi:hypothetical protein
MGAADYLAMVAADQSNYNPFNLVLLEPESAGDNLFFFF